MRESLAVWQLLYELFSYLFTWHFRSTQMLLLAPNQKSRLQDYCASSVYIKTLMLRGYGFNETSFSSISFQKKVRKYDRIFKTQRLIFGQLAVIFCCCSSRRGMPLWAGLWATCWVWAICCRQRLWGWRRPWPWECGEYLSLSSSSSSPQSCFTSYFDHAMGRRKEAMMAPSRYCSSTQCSQKTIPH